MKEGNNKHDRHEKYLPGDPNAGVPGVIGRADKMPDEDMIDESVHAVGQID